VPPKNAMPKLNVREDNSVCSTDAPDVARLSLHGLRNGRP
jgi:hypothetical protein